MHHLVADSLHIQHPHSFFVVSTVLLKTTTAKEYIFNSVHLNFVETFENSTATMVGFTLNEADKAWIKEQERLLIKTLNFENHYDETGEYKFKYNIFLMMRKH